jgi:site-specific recombinase XerD
MRRGVPRNNPQDTRERRVIQQWRASGLGETSIATYITWVRRFRVLIRNKGLDEVKQLTLAHAKTFAKEYVGARRGKRVKAKTRYVALNAMHAWASALRLLGEPVPPWRPAPSPPRRTPVLSAYEEYRRCHRGVSIATLRRDMDTATAFIESLRSKGRDIRRTRVADIDRFVEDLSSRVGKRTVADTCSSLRGFLRFLFATKRLRRDLSGCVVAPRYRTDEGPPRSLPWEDIRRILRAVSRDRPVELRDYAMLLLMATYGLGSGEIVQLELGDVDWRADILRVRRHKTGVLLELPLLPAVAQALTAYLRRCRSKRTLARTIFVSLALPHRPLTTGAIRHRIREYARRAGVSAPRLGAHIFRHSHATRQIDAGAPFKIVGDILGHLRPASTSVYIRVALRRLRTVALPVPR